MVFLAADDPPLLAEPDDLSSPPQAATSTAAPASAATRARFTTDPPQGSRALAGAALELIDVHGRDEDESDRDLLPERLDVRDDEPVLQHGRDEHADDRADDAADTAEEARPAQDHPGDHLQRIRRMPR